ncbi:sulfotransferase domain-containing protein [Methylobacterium sp. A54F]
MTQPDPRVRFLIAGVQKGGTTALFAYLNGHPGLDMAACKEVHFFDREEGVDWAQPDYAAYHAAFGPASDRVRGEATPIYIYWPQSLARIRAYNPAMRLVFLFRDPAERAYSHWRMERGRGYDAMPFGEAIRAGRARVDDPAAPGHHRVFSYVERGFYAAQLDRVHALFPREQVLALTSDALSKDPDGTLARVCRHIGVAPPPPGQAPVRANVGSDWGSVPDLAADDRAYLDDLYREDAARFTALTGLAFGKAAR